MQCNCTSYYTCTPLWCITQQSSGSSNWDFALLVIWGFMNNLLSLDGNFSERANFALDTQHTVFYAEQPRWIHHIQACHIWWDWPFDDAELTDVDFDGILCRKHPTVFHCKFIGFLLSLHQIIIKLDGWKDKKLFSGKFLSSSFAGKALTIHDHDSHSA